MSSSPPLESSSPAPLNVAAAAGWLALCMIAGIVIGWLAVLIQTRFSPAILFPILIGLALGGVCLGAMRLCQVAHRAIVLTGIVLAWLALVAGEHYFSFRSAVAATAEEQAKVAMALRAMPATNQMKLPAGPPESLREYLSLEASQGRPFFGTTLRGTAVWLSWIIDALLSLAPAIVIGWIGLTRPYCKTCGSWYRPIRSGKLEPPAIPPIAEVCGFAPPPADASAYYRLWQCNAGCGKSRFELSWTEGGGGSANAWLTAEYRNRVMALLDRPAA